MKRKIKFNIDNPLVYLTIILTLVAVFQVITPIFQDDSEFISSMNMSLFLIWVSVIFRASEIFIDHKLIKDISKLSLALAIFIQALYILSLVGTFFSELTFYLKILLPTLFITITSKYFRMGRIINRKLEIILKEYYGKKSSGATGYLFIFLMIVVTVISDMFGLIDIGELSGYGIFGKLVIYLVLIYLVFPLIYQISKKKNK